MLASNLEKFFKSYNTNLSLIIIFNKTINLFILRTAIFRTIDLDSDHYIILNYMLNYLKKLFA